MAKPVDATGPYSSKKSKAFLFGKDIPILLKKGAQNRSGVNLLTMISIRLRGKKRRYEEL
jgi:hypothetical protein